MSFVLDCPPIKQLKAWNDPYLLKRAPFRQVFDQWKVNKVRTQPEKEKRRKALVSDLWFARTASVLQHWLDLAFNARQGYTKAQKVTVGEHTLGVFVDVQWALANDDQGAALQVLMREYRKRGFPYINAPVTPALPAQVSTSNAEKRKARMGRCKENKRHKIEENGDSEGLSGRVDVAPAMVIPYPPSAFTDVKTAPLPPGPQTQEPVLVKDSSRQKDNRSNGPKTGEAQIQKAAMPVLPLRRTKPRKAAARVIANPTAQPKKEHSISADVAMATTSSTTDIKATVEDLPQDTHIYLVSITQEPPLEQKPIFSKDSDMAWIEQADPRNPGIFPPTIEIPVHEKVVDESPLEAAVPLGPALPSALHNWLQEPAEDRLASDAQIPRNECCEETAPPVFYGPRFKPCLPNYPPIWAQSRQEVCESFDWFRSYQGGVYHARNTVRGYLLSAFSARRDKFEHDGRLIISHGGGKAQSVHTHRGQSVIQEAEDQLAKDKSVRALLSNFRSRRPLVLLIDNKYALFPYDLASKGVTYAVLGFYTIVHAWAEYQPADNEHGRVVRYKFAFQWCESQGKPWWLPSHVISIDQYLREHRLLGEPEEDLDVDFQMGNSNWEDQSASLFEHIENISTVCEACHQASPRVYAPTWTCLNRECIRFWRDVAGIPVGEELDYNPQFLELAPASSLAIPTEKLEPVPPFPISRGPTTDYAYTRGWHCRKCGRLSCRFKWEHWECMHCKATLVVKGRVRPATDFLYLAPPVPYQQCYVAENSGVTKLPVKTLELVSGDAESIIQCFTYQLPGSRGQIHHIKTGHLSLNQEADDIFWDYQTQASTGALPFRRWPMRAHKCRGTLLTNYFSQNAGVPYQYVGGAENTLPFDQVPDAVVKARRLIETRIKQALGKDASFNEVLSAAYMERQRMAFHTDDEIGLGPLIAGLSLGSPALMHFRLLARQVAPGTQPNVAISFVLRHGDVLAMDGAGVQQFYEHTVVPANFRIATTARYIGSTHPKREEAS